MLCENTRYPRRLQPRPPGAVRVFGGPRGLLSDYPPDVVYVVNGRPITKGDLLDSKRARQQKRLERICRPSEPVQKPGFVHVFCNHGFFYTGWWLYVLTAKRYWELGYRRWGNEKLTLQAMRLFPCGLLPMRENLRAWMPRFAATYPRPTAKHPTDNGLALVRVTVTADKRELLDIERWKRKRR